MFTYYEGQGNGSTYGAGHNTVTLYITNEETGEKRAWSDWTYMDCEDDEDLQCTLKAIWEQDADMGYDEGMDYTVVKEAS